MYVEGIISKIQGYQAKIKMPQFDDQETEWLHILQLFTVGNKSGFKPAIGTLVAALLSDDMTEGCILGAIYNDEDAPPEDTEGKEFIQFSDGVGITHENGQLIFNAQTVIVNADINCSKDISDKTSSMQSMRDTYNSHTNPNGGVVAEKMQ